MYTRIAMYHSALTLRAQRQMDGPQQSQMSHVKAHNLLHCLYHRRTMIMRDRAGAR